MATGPGIEDAGGPIARLFGEGSATGMDEGELLRRFAQARDPVALEVLVARHGPMVLGVCRRVLGNRHSSEDAFQATFLVLARKAGSIRDPDRLGPWLHGVAHRVAVRARADLARRNARERPGAEDLAMETPADEAGFDRIEVRAALDEEVRRLPAKFREPIVLCYLDGLTHDEAATRLRCPVGTVRSRLSTGRAKLRERLGRRGVAVPSGAFEAVLAAEGASAVVSHPLLITTVKAATAFAGGLAGATAAGMVSAEVASLAEGVSKTMILSKLKVAGGLALAGMMTVGVGGVAAYQVGGAGQDAKVETPADESPEAVIAKLRLQARKSDLETMSLKAEIDALKAQMKAVRDQLEPAKPKAATATQKDVAARVVESPAPGPRPTADPFAQPGGPTGIGGGGAAGGIGVGGFGGGGRPGAKGPAQGASGGMGAVMGNGGIGAGPAGLSGGMGGIGAPIAGFGASGRAGAASGKVATFQTDDFVIVREPKGGSLASYSTETGQWTSYEIREGTTEVVPLYSAGVVALLARGNHIDQIATFVPRAGRWYPIDLKEPASGEASPIIGATQAIYPIGRRVYAFSVPTRSWDVLELPEGAKPAPITFANRATVEHGDHVYIFSVKTGKWADHDLKADKPAEPAAK